MRAAASTFYRFIGDRRGNISVIFALACVPLITAVGCAVDYSRATRLALPCKASAPGRRGSRNERYDR
jgi:hypothetical protein